MAINTSQSFRPDQENVAYVGAGVTLKGEISVPDLIVVDGTIEGDITARVVCVGQTGVIRGNISATEADISGSITDHVEIKQLLIVRATGQRPRGWRAWTSSSRCCTARMAKTAQFRDCSRWPMCLMSAVVCWVQLVAWTRS